MFVFSSVSRAASRPVAAGAPTGRASTPDARLGLPASPVATSMDIITMETAAMSCANDRNVFRHAGDHLDMTAFCRFAAKRLPGSTAAQLAAICGATVSTAEKWLRGETRPSAAHLAALIAFFGPAFLAATMPGTRDWSERQARDERIAALLAELGSLLAAE